ncbi:ER membrane protein complex subunit 10 [Parasteatoda tepidariorum]|uniref:ER membrane protein complex subunit 10 n=1 Tax=Parasteatoda tepidariorum TaxID=114398 RepID=UPI00077FA305|nr:ER membrane protein complex subunit 10 [Parasteatoda tepidariorum]
MNSVKYLRFLLAKVAILIFLFHLDSCEEEPDSHVSFYIHHSIESNDSPPVYTPRGIVTYFSSRNEAIYSDEESLTNEDILKLKKLAESDGIYRIKILTKPDDPDEDAVFSFTKACAIYESGLTDTITIALDQSGAPYGIAISAIPAHCIGSHVPTSKLMGFNTSINFVTLANGPSPDTLTYIQRLEQEKAEKARGEQGDNRSFLAKYWMYIIPFVIFVFISGAGNPEGQGGGR